MSDNDDSKKAFGVRVRFEECEHGNMHVTDVRPLTDVEVVYDAPGSDEVLASSTVGWSRAYAANWDANFGDKTEEPELN